MSDEKEKKEKTVLQEKSLITLDQLLLQAVIDDKSDQEQLVLLLERGANPYARSSEGDTIFQVAIKSENKNAIQKLLGAMKKAGITDITDDAKIKYSIVKCYDPIKHPDLNEALLASVKIGATDSFLPLLLAGANFYFQALLETARRKNVLNHLFDAIERAGRIVIAQKRSQSDIGLLVFASGGNRVELVQCILKYDNPKPDRMDLTYALNYAVACKAKEVLLPLLLEGANFYLKLTYKDGKAGSALNMAAQSSFIRHLLTAIDNAGKTAITQKQPEDDEDPRLLVYAAAYDRGNLVKRILEYNKPPQTDLNEALYEAAVNKAGTEVLSYLLRAGADFFTKRNYVEKEKQVKKDILEFLEISSLLEFLEKLLKSDAITSHIVQAALNELHYRTTRGNVTFDDEWIKSLQTKQLALQLREMLSIKAEDAKPKDRQPLALMPITRNALIKLLDASLKRKDGALLKPAIWRNFFGEKLEIKPTDKHEKMAKRFSGIAEGDQIEPSAIANLSSEKREIVFKIDGFFNNQETLSFAGIESLSKFLRDQGIQETFKSALLDYVKQHKKLSTQPLESMSSSTSSSSTTLTSTTVSSASPKGSPKFFPQALSSLDLGEEFSIPSDPSTLGVERTERIELETQNSEETVHLEI